MPSAEGRIGFVDDRLDNYHTNVFLDALRGPLKGRGYTAAGCVALQEDAGRKWAAERGVPYFSDYKELDRSCDFYMVLAPSTTETHLELCRQVVPFGKPVWVDKTFAPDLQSAKRIFKLADEHGVAMDTASALRYTKVQEYAGEAGRDAIRHMVAWGAGSKMEEYLVHPVEMVVSCMGPEAERLTRRGEGNEAQLLMDFSGGRTAVVNVYLKTKTPFAAGVTTHKETRYIEVDTERCFVDALGGVLDLFDSGAPTIDRKESLAIRAIIDAALDPASLSGWSEIGS